MFPIGLREYRRMSQSTFQFVLKTSVLPDNPLESKSQFQTNQRPLSLHRSILTHALYHVKHPSHSKAHRQRFQHSFRLSLLLLNLNILIDYHFSSCSKVIPFLELITKVFTLFFLVHFMLILHTFLRFYAKFQLRQVCYFLQFLNTFGNVQVLFNVIDESASFRQYLFHVVWHFSITKAKFSLSFRF